MDWPDGVGPMVTKAAATKPQSLPFVDDQGKTVITPAGPLAGQPMQHPANFDPSFFVERGLAARRRTEELGHATDNGGGYLAGLALEAQDLAHFRQNKSWDTQRVDGVVQQEWVDYASVAIGLYSAAAGYSPDDILKVQDEYAARNSEFGSAVKDDVYPHLAHRNVLNTLLGFQLYNSGQIGAAPDSKPSER